jgi:hypothetical protein
MFLIRPEHSLSMACSIASFILSRFSAQNTFTLSHGISSGSSANNSENFLLRLTPSAFDDDPGA